MAIVVSRKVWERIDAVADGTEAGATLVLIGSDSARVVGAAGTAKQEAGDPGWDAVAEVETMLPVGLAAVGVCIVVDEDSFDKEAASRRARGMVARGWGQRDEAKEGAAFHFIFRPRGGAPAVACALSAGPPDSDPGSRITDARIEIATSDGAGSDDDDAAAWLRCRCDLALDVVYKRGVGVGVREAAVRAAILASLPSSAADVALLATAGPAMVRQSPDGGITPPPGPLASPLEVSLFVRRSPVTAATTAASAPTLRFAPLARPASPSEASSDPVATERLSVRLDVLCFVGHHTTTQTKAPEAALLSKLGAQAGAIAACAASLPSCRRLSAFHFKPASLRFPVTLAHAEDPPADLADTLTARRAALHERLGLPQDRPLLRPSNALAFGGPSGGACYAAFQRKLMNVHEALGPSGVKGGTLSLVNGPYCYFHYMQDRFDDGGWGCAYRSLQTIVSWFVLNNYTTTHVPSHRTIQETLVGLGDKPATFVGSRQWIGAIEISFILDALLGVSSKVMTFNSGADIPTKAREIAHHFQTQGTPVMIGGGVLAYTLLGVDYNASTGECAFLILDPHYTGGEDIGKITQGTWVGWKRLGDSAAAGGDLFVQSAFYNFLCPQRPAVV